jgi:hypothetical protein
MICTVKRLSLLHFRIGLAMVLAVMTVVPPSNAQDQPLSQASQAKADTGGVDNYSNIRRSD